MAIDPARPQPCALGTVHVPGVGGDQHRLCLLDAHRPAGVPVRLGCGLPAPYLLDPDVPFDHVLEARPLEQPLRDGRGSVRERRDAHPGFAQKPDPVRDIGLDGQRAHSPEHVFDGLFGRRVQPGTVTQEPAQDGSGDIPEGRILAARRERHAVPQGGREPGRQELRRCAHLFEAFAEPAEIGQRLVDIEQRDGRSDRHDQIPPPQGSSIRTRQPPSAWRRRTSALRPLMSIASPSG